MTSYPGIIGALAAAALTLCASDAIAQTQTSADGSGAAEATEGLRARQAKLLAQLEREPDNLGAMFEYARVSAQLLDYEPAIATLERMLLYRSDLPRVRLELGALYFRLGSYEASRQYFLTVLENSDPPEDVRARINAYLDEIEQRTRKHRLTGIVTLGPLFSTNANLGPNSADVLVGGARGTLESSAVASEDWGARATAQLTHIYDFDQETTDIWRTDVSAYGLKFDTVDEGDVFAIGVKTGPRLSVDDSVYGVKLRPFLDGSYLDVGGDAFYLAGGAGLGVETVTTDGVYLFSEFGGRYLDYFDPRDFEDGWEFRALAGGAYAPLRDLTFRVVGFGERKLADVDFEQSWETGGQLSVVFDYDPRIGWVDRKWKASAYAKVTYRRFDEAEAAIDPDTRREDVDLSLGAAHSFELQDGIGVRLDVDYLVRDSNIPNFELDNLSVGTSLTYRF